MTVREKRSTEQVSVYFAVHRTLSFHGYVVSPVSQSVVALGCIDYAVDVCGTRIVAS